MSSTFFKLVKFFVTVTIFLQLYRNAGNLSSLLLRHNFLNRIFWLPYPELFLKAAFRHFA